MKWLWGSLIALFIVFMGWHEWRGPPLTTEETEAILANLRMQRGADDGNGGGHDVPQMLRTLVASDDGAQYFMVNFIKYRTKAIYPEGADYEKLGDDAHAADMRYSKIVLPELLKRGSYPIYVSNVVGEFITPPGAETWDTVAIVRYRSRRDMLDMMEPLQRLGGGVHKWAAIETTQVFPAHAIFRIAPLPLLVALVLLTIGFAAQAFSGRRRRGSVG